MLNAEIFRLQSLESVAMRKAINFASPNMNNIQSKINGQMDWPAPAAEEKTKLVAGVLIILSTEYKYLTTAACLY